MFYILNRKEEEEEEHTINTINIMITNYACLNSAAIRESEILIRVIKERKRKRKRNESNCLIIMILKQIHFFILMLEQISVQIFSRSQPLHNRLQLAVAYLFID